MKKSTPYIIIATLVGAGVLAQSLFNTPSQVTPPVTDTPTATATATANITSNEPCGYMWAYHNADELSGMIDEDIRALDPAGSGNASFYGEDCVYADGHSTFSAMETDFYVRIPVTDLADEEGMGNWLSQVLQIVLQYPRDLIQGNYGFVEFWFAKSDTEHVIVRVPIQQYMEGTHGITSAALFQMFYVKP